VTPPRNPLGARSGPARGAYLRTKDTSAKKNVALHCFRSRLQGKSTHALNWPQRKSLARDHGHILYTKSPAIVRILRPCSLRTPHARQKSLEDRVAVANMRVDRCRTRHRCRIVTGNYVRYIDDGVDIRRPAAFQYRFLLLCFPVSSSPTYLGHLSVRPDVNLSTYVYPNRHLTHTQCLHPT